MSSSLEAMPAVGMVQLRSRLQRDSNSTAAQIMLLVKLFEEFQRRGCHHFITLSNLHDFHQCSQGLLVLLIAASIQLNSLW